jgi:vanillate O-demethylase monooxygenase subunit
MAMLLGVEDQPGTEPGPMRRRRVITNTSPALARCWHPVARTEDLSDGPVQVWLRGRPWALAHTADGWAAWVDQCPHRRAPLSAGRVVDDHIQCGYHGWRFDRAGTCRAIPALGPDAVLPPRARAVPAWGVTERYGLVWLAEQEPLADILDLPAWDDPSRRRSGPSLAVEPIGAALFIDNQLDTGHFAFLHAGTFGDPARPVVDAGTVTRDGWTVTGQAEVPIDGAAYPEVTAGGVPATERRTMTWRYRAPFALELRLEYPGMGSNVISFFVQPEHERQVRLYTASCLEVPPGVGADVVAARDAFERRVGEEDLTMQRRMLDLSLPLDPGKEVSTRADRLSIEYRRVLADLVDAALEA